MCGIAGYVGTGSKETLERMIDAIRHRGPDNQGFLVRGSVGLSQARLAIIDTSAAAHQPMMSPDHNLAIVFNGEIYNFLELRSELEARGCFFRTTSDTEVILWLYKEYGEQCFERLVGMFTIALYDFQAGKLFLARDRMGEKPLYYSQKGNTLYFGSELKALLATGEMEKKINEAALSSYLALDYVPTPLSILENIHKLEPATMLVFEGSGVVKRKFWSPPQETHTLSLDDAKSQLDTLLARSVKRQLIADVPLGVFLSGGLDSSTVAYYAAHASERPIETFSIGFDESAFDESAYAKEVAQLLKTHHHEKRVTAQDALDLVPHLAAMLDEPMADASIIPTTLLSRFAREHVTVALGGDGGDELFAGYPTFKAERFYGAYAILPQGVRSLINSVAEFLPANHGYFTFSYNAKKFASANAGDAFTRHLEWLGTFSESQRSRILAHANTFDPYSSARAFEGDFHQADAGNSLLWLYARTYLMDQVLVKVDRAAMSASLETRAPLLDHTVVDFAFSLPFSMKYNGTSKYLLKELMRAKLPPGIADRKKKGFGVPVAEWLTGPLKSLCTDLLSHDRIAKQGIFNAAEITRLVDQHMSMNRDNRKELWNLMIFQMWYDKWV